MLIAAVSLYFQCLLVIGSGCHFCSGGQGLFLWYRDGHLATSIQLAEESKKLRKKKILDLFFFMQPYLFESLTCYVQGDL